MTAAGYVYPIHARVGKHYKENPENANTHLVEGEVLKRLTALAVEFLNVSQEQNVDIANRQKAKQVINDILRPYLDEANGIGNSAIQRVFDFSDGWDCVLLLKLLLPSVWKYNGNQYRVLLLTNMSALESKKAQFPPSVTYGRLSHDKSTVLRMWTVPIEYFVEHMKFVEINTTSGENYGVSINPSVS